MKINIKKGPNNSNIDLEIGNETIFDNFGHNNETNQEDVKIS